VDLTSRDMPPLTDPVLISGKSFSVKGSSVRPLDVSPSGRIQRFLVTPYILSFVIFKLRLTTFITANDGGNPAYSVKTQAPGAKCLGGETSRVRTDEGAKRL